MHVDLHGTACAGTGACMADICPNEAVRHACCRGRLASTCVGMCEVGAWGSGGSLPCPHGQAVPVAGTASCRGESQRTSPQATQRLASIFTVANVSHAR